jgi:hypothetical protein
VASGRVLVAERRLEQQQRALGKRQNEISYHFDGDLGELTPSLSEEESSLRDVHHSSNNSQQDMQRDQHVKTQSTLLESLNVEALWKVTKIELDKVVRQACELILLKGDYFFVGHAVDGWVGSRSCLAVNAAEGRRRAAETLIQMGNVMVEQSKEGTSWLE